MPRDSRVPMRGARGAASHPISINFRPILHTEALPSTENIFECSERQKRLKITVQPTCYMVNQSTLLVGLVKEKFNIL